MYNREPLVVKQTREIPTEIMFDTNNATQDKLIKNRYWFDLPEQWQSTLTKDPILGIRNMFVARGCRHVEFSFTMTLFNETENTEVSNKNIIIDVYLDGDKTIKYIVERYYTQTAEQVEEWITEEDYDESISEYIIKCIPSINYYHNLDNKCLFTFTLYNEQLITNTSTYHISIPSIDFAEDSNMIFDIDNTITTDDYITIPIFWDRYHLYIKSSLASMTVDNYLGHTDRSYTPIKYYRLSSRENKFWIELYSTRNHSTISILGDDKQDDLMIEGIVLLDASGMI